MKRIITLLIVACLLLMLVTEAMAAREFKSNIFDGLTVELMERNLSIVKEESSGGDFPVKLTFNLEGREKDTQIVAYFTLKEDYLENVTIDLPQSVFKKWEAYYKKQMTETQFSFTPDDLKLMSVKDFESQDDPGELLYFAYTVSGKYKGNWLINHLGVVYGVHIQVTGQAKEFDRDSSWAVMSAYTTCVDYALGIINALSGE